MEDSEGKRISLLKRSEAAYRLRYSDRYLGPGNIVMKFKNFNPLKDPQIEASQYEDSFPDVGREEMERRFSERRSLFLDIYDRERPRQSLAQYMEAAQTNECYTYKIPVSSGIVSLFLGGSVPKHFQKGELPECHLLGFVDGKGKVGCMAHPLAETSRGYDGRDQVGFFSHTGCCRSVGCEASKEFMFLSTSAMKIFDRAVDGMSWYEYSRHATSVLVYYLRSYDQILQKLDERGLLDALTLEQLAAFTNSLYSEWPIKKPDGNANYPLNTVRIPQFPMPGIELSVSCLDWCGGRRTECERTILTDVRTSSEAVTLEVPVSLWSTGKGYRFQLKFPQEECVIDVHLKSGNKPTLKGTLVAELWKVGRDKEKSRSELTKGKKSLLYNLIRHLSIDSDLLSSLEILSTDIPLAEKILYIALDSWFLRDYFAIQLQQARDYVERRIDAFRSELRTSA